jgi:hypothetical protein
MSRIHVFSDIIVNLGKAESPLSITIVLTAHSEHGTDA